MELLTKEAGLIQTMFEGIGELKYEMATILTHYRPIMDGEIFLTNEDVCRLLHVSKRSLQQYRDDKLISYIQLPGKIIYRESDIAKMLEENYTKAI